MKELIVILALASICNGIKYDALVVKFGWTGEEAGKEYFFRVPRTIDEAVAAGYQLNVRPNGPLMELKMYCAPRRIVCPLYHSTGFVAGMQIGAPVSAFDPVLKPERYLVKWSAPAAGREPAGEFWTSTQFYVTEESLNAGAIPTAANGSTLQNGGVWVHDLEGQLIKVALIEADLASTTHFKKQNCFINMGTHYYYNMSRQLPSDKFLLPWFPLVLNGVVHGVGFQTFGRAPLLPEEKENWLERIPQRRDVPLKTIPDAPEWYLDNFMEYGGLVSIHIYYISEPWLIRCKPSDSVAPIPSSSSPHPTNSIWINALAALFAILTYYSKGAK